MLTLAWMRNQEKGVSFTLEYTTEDVLDFVSWRVEGTVRAEVVVRGGIYADCPGFGRTV